LDELLEFACQPPRVYRHHWSAGDIAVWDNRCVLHHACAYDYGERRVMKHTRIRGEATEQAAHCGYTLPI
jgi:alpha-ketoglutarate-dependent taurine dioxygenase